MYLYDNFIVKETSKSYVVTREIPGEEKIKVRIPKELLEKVKTNEDSEMVAIICSILEFIRFDSKKFGDNAEPTILTRDGFPEKLSMLLGTKSIEEIVEELSELKYHETKEIFFQE